MCILWGDIWKNLKNIDFYNKNQQIKVYYVYHGKLNIILEIYHTEHNLVEDTCAGHKYRQLKSYKAVVIKGQIRVSFLYN